MLVKGKVIKISDAINNECWSTATSVKIFAFESVIIDSDIDKNGKQAEVYIISPEWTIEGNRRILLNGEDGAGYSHSRGNRGADGESGKPGGPGGCFFSIGDSFKNGNQLTIEANGGKGGDGQNGGDGFDGIDGASPEEPRNEIIYAIEQQYNGRFKYDWTFNFYDYTVTIYGKDAQKPTPGGNGGLRGAGGFPGQIRELSMDGNSKFISHVEKGMNQ